MYCCAENTLNNRLKWKKAREPEYSEPETDTLAQNNCSMCSQCSNRSAGAANLNNSILKTESHCYYVVIKIKLHLSADFNVNDESHYFFSDVSLLSRFLNYKKSILQFSSNSLVQSVPSLFCSVCLPAWLTIHPQHSILSHQVKQSASDAEASCSEEKKLTVATKKKNTAEKSKKIEWDCTKN